MSAPVQTEAPAQAEQPAKKSGWGKKAREPKAPKPPKVKKPRRPWGMAPWLLIAALLTAGAAVGSLYYPIPGLTATPATPATPAANEEQKTETQPADALAVREQAVAQKETDLAAREEALKQKEADVSKLLKDLGVTEAENTSLKRMANMYVNMAPFKAAPLMEQLDVSTAVQVLRLMTDEEAAAILAYMDAARAAELMQEFTKPPVANSPGG